MSVCPTCGHQKKPYGLTDQQRALHAFIIHYTDAHGGISPSYDEMKDAIGLASKSGVHRLLNGLQERGYIDRRLHRARTVTVLHRLAVAQDAAE